ncbi:MAG: peptidase S8 [Planctomycetes bacterium]|nr:peptidase S8 [Planctomycetota bacterium]
MKRSLFSSASLALLFAGAGAATASADGAAERVPDELLVKFRDRAVAAAAHAQIGATPIEELAQIGVTLVKLPAGLAPERAAALYAALPSVEYAHPNYLSHAVHLPNDPSWPSQYGPTKIRCEQAWDMQKGDANVVIAIVDTGIDKSHGDLAAKLVAGYDFVSNDTDPDDNNGHGTHCAGIAAALTDNALGVAGVASNCSLMAVKVLNGSGSGSNSDVAAGINWAADHGAHVISLSLGGSAKDATLEAAVNYAWNKGVVVVAAAGNNGNQTKFYPAAYGNCIAVASTDSNDNRSSFSTYGSWVDVAAPGSSIFSTYDGNAYATLSGTSMACPHVAGLAGLIRSHVGPYATATEVRERVQYTTDPVGTFVATGRVNAENALKNEGGGVTKSHFWPASITVASGSQVGGAISDVNSSDDARLSLQSAPGTGGQLLDWHATFNTSLTGTLVQVELLYETRLSSNASVTLQAFNFAANRWETLATVAWLTTDTQRLFKGPAGGVAPYISGAGQMQIRSTRAGSGAAFTQSIDEIRISFVTQ